MARKAKFQQIARIIEDRVRAGHYALTDMPGERRLAQEMGVSHMTARKAVQKLIAEGVIPRRRVGQAAAANVRLSPSKDRLHLAFVIPAFDSPLYAIHRVAIEKAAAARGGSVSVVTYAGSSDPSVTEALNGPFSGIFLSVAVETLPSILVQRIARDAHRIVTLGADLTHMGIPRIDARPPKSIHLVMRHLRDLKHKHVVCFNTQPHDLITIERINEWQESIQNLGLKGTLLDDPVKWTERPDVYAHKVALKLLQSADRPTAIFCTTVAAAIGVNRAAWELGIVVGRGLSLCTCDDPEVAQLMTPSITTLDNPDLTPYVAQGLDWIMSKGKSRNTGLRFGPDRVSLRVGESTGPA